ncbi:hypothetical protein [Ancylobacter pratisalsi]|uniref:Uncharacterized protein n=1 Tax=Ancylobacter pratisalsi TaxID=1745854 RepID=A0A6P1YNS3_9HYPH|nr:hypothetical protein [Ancylobacter pratisalsi]QIB34550.1 hypothetical protein G3A50_13120 [Ancylobacter pratisalsi]
MPKQIEEEEWAKARELIRVCRSQRGGKARHDHELLEAMPRFTGHRFT